MCHLTFMKRDIGAGFFAGALFCITGFAVGGGALICFGAKPTAFCGGGACDAKPADNPPSDAIFFCGATIFPIIYLL